MNEKYRERWRKIRAKGKARFLIRGIIIYMLCSIFGTAIWRLGRIYFSGKPYEFLFESLDTAIVAAISFGIVGYWQSSREWRQSEKEYASDQLTANTVIK